MEELDKEEEALSFEDNIMTLSHQVVLPPTRDTDPRSKAKYNLISRLLFWYVQHGYVSFRNLSVTYVWKVYLYDFII